MPARSLPAQRLLPLALLGAFLTPLKTLAQQVAGIPSPAAFDVASVRPSKPDAPGHSTIPLDSDSRGTTDGLLIATHQPLWRYISFAYHLTGSQELSLRFNMFSGAPKSGAPTWVTGTFNAPADFFDISARAPAGTSVQQMRLMMQSLLADRFHLLTHQVEAESAVFALEPVKAGVLGPDLQPHPASDTCAANAPAPASPVGTLPPVCGVIQRTPAATPGPHYGGRAVSLAFFADSVPLLTGLAVTPRPVIDRTGLAGLYDLTLGWSHDSSTDEAVLDNSANFRDALKTQMGLKLVPARAPIRFLVIDRVERPSDN